MTLAMTHASLLRPRPIPRAAPRAQVVGDILGLQVLHGGIVGIHSGASNVSLEGEHFYLERVRVLSVPSRLVRMLPLRCEFSRAFFKESAGFHHEISTTFLRDLPLECLWDLSADSAYSRRMPNTVT
jgi:hypothetical protein